MEASPFYTAVCGLLAFSLVACQAPLRSDGGQYVGYTKTALVHRLGLPAEITLPVRDASAREVWSYYWKNHAGQVREAAFQFNGERVSGAPDVEPTGILRTDSDDDYALIHRYKANLDRAIHHL